MHIDEIIKNLPALFCSVLVSVLFIQSGLDKIFDWKGNLGWLTSHFSKTFLAGMVPVMLGTMTLMEIGTGILAAAGLIYFIVAGSTLIIFYASVLGALSIVSLFFGQRIAKDYPGAAVLVPYFLLLVVTMYLTQPAR
ncbi:MAG: DoxX family protein [Acidobacteriota bacterium]